MIRIAAERDIAAPPDRIYRILADYTTHHPRILPPAFTSLIVEHGGIGAGTIIRFSIRLMGRTTTYHQQIEEPDPGRVLVEADLNTDLTTTFTVTPTANGCQVRMESKWTPRGAQGFVERVFAARMMTPVYQDQLQRLDKYARDHIEI